MISMKQIYLLFKVLIAHNGDKTFIKLHFNFRICNLLSVEENINDASFIVDDKKQLEDSFIKVFTNIIKTWQEERESPDTGSGY